MHNWNSSVFFFSFVFEFLLCLDKNGNLWQFIFLSFPSSCAFDNNFEPISWNKKRKKSWFWLYSYRVVVEISVENCKCLNVINFSGEIKNLHKTCNFSFRYKFFLPRSFHSSLCCMTILFTKSKIKFKEFFVFSAFNPSIK